VIGVGGVLVSLTAAGLITGYSWLGGSNSALYIDVGDGWAVGSGATDALTLIAVGFALITFLGQLAYVSVVAGTVFSGRAVTQDLLVEVSATDE
jgi:hypothetical protein